MVDFVQHWHPRAELETKWARLIRSNPQRVVGIFDLRSYEGKAKNRWGDAPEVYRIIPSPGQDPHSPLRTFRRSLRKSAKSCTVVTPYGNGWSALDLSTDFANV